MGRFGQIIDLTFVRYHVGGGILCSLTNNDYSLSFVLIVLDIFEKFPKSNLPCLCDGTDAVPFRREHAPLVPW